MNEFRKFLPEGYEVTDADLERIVNDLTQLAEILVDAVIRKQKHKEKQSTSLPLKTDGDDAPHRCAFYRQKEPGRPR